ncbi:MAG: hypothetical protein WAL85_19815 [Candidatus Korobacteraceae bacterium]
MKISTEELAHRLCREIRENLTLVGPRPPDKESTKCVFKVLHEIGQSLGYEVLGTHIEACQEWLLDVVWWKNYSWPEIGIALAVECEWKTGKRELVDDFQKLLCTKAPLKVFIYDGGNVPADGNEPQTWIKEEMRKYHHHVAGETYLFAAFGDRDQYCHKFVVPHDGALESVDFELLVTPEVVAQAALA